MQLDLGKDGDGSYLRSITFIVIGSPSLLNLNGPRSSKVGFDEGVSHQGGARDKTSFLGGIHWHTVTRPDQFPSTTAVKTV